MSTPEPKRRRRFYQFSLRTLLVIVTLAAVCAAAWAYCIEPYRRQREAMAAIDKLGGTYKTEDAPGWSRYLDKNPQDVIAVDLADCDRPEEYLPHVVRLPALKTLVVGGHQFGDEQLATLRRARSLRALVLDSTKVTDEAIKELKEELSKAAVYTSERRAIAALAKVGVHVTDEGAYRLLPSGPVPVPWRSQFDRPQSLCSEVGDGYFLVPATSAGICASSATDTELEWLSNLGDLRRISVRETPLTGEFLAHVRSPGLEEIDILGPLKSKLSIADVRRFKNLRTLAIEHADISDDDMAHLGELEYLARLELGDVRLTDRAVPHIARLPRLRDLRIFDTDLSADGIRKLREALPQCTIWDIK